MIAVRLATISLALLLGNSIRLTRKDNASGVPYDAWEWTLVDNLYTFGSPMTSGGQLKNPIARDGCFKGYRVLRESDANEVDLVTTLLTFNGFNHAYMPSLRVSKDSSPKTEACGWEYSDSTRRAKVELHDKDDYASLSRPRLGVVASLGLATSYTDSLPEVAAKANAEGWGLVDSAVVKTGFFIKNNEVSHLFQNPSTLDCMLTFEGSDSSSNWGNNLQFIRVKFCGLPSKVHRGFQDAMQVITQSGEWKNKILPKLPYCKKLSVVGHSLGGAIATLFSACANNKYNAAGDKDNKDVTWTKQTPKKLSYK